MCSSTMAVERNSSIHVKTRIWFFHALSSWKKKLQFSFTFYSNIDIHLFLFNLIKQTVGRLQLIYLATGQRSEVLFDPSVLFIQFYFGNVFFFFLLWWINSNLSRMCGWLMNTEKEIVKYLFTFTFTLNI